MSVEEKSEHIVYHPHPEIEVAFRFRYYPWSHIQHGNHRYIEDQVEVIPLSNGHYEDSYTQTRFMGTKTQEVMRNASNDLIAHCVRVWIQKGGN